MHCCKHPFHVEFAGYKGKKSLPADHPDYALKRVGNRMALNLVDMDRFDPSYLDFNRKMLEKAFEFLDEHYNNGDKILIHCNQGESRGPTIGLLYVSRMGEYNYSNFHDSVESFKIKYPRYSPKANIYKTVESLWGVFVEV